MTFGEEKSIPERRGMKAGASARTKPYTAQSYAAQYGIDLDDAEWLVKNHDTHEQIDRAINSQVAADPILRKRLFGGQRQSYMAKEPMFHTAARLYGDRGAIEVAIDTLMESDEAYQVVVDWFRISMAGENMEPGDPLDDMRHSAKFSGIGEETIKRQGALAYLIWNHPDYREATS